MPSRNVLARAKSNHLFAPLPPNCLVKLLTCSVLWTDAARFHRLCSVNRHMAPSKRSTCQVDARCRVRESGGDEGHEPLAVSLRLRPLIRSRPVHGATGSTIVEVVVGPVGAEDEATFVVAAQRECRRAHRTRRKARRSTGCGRRRRDWRWKSRRKCRSGARRSHQRRWRGLDISATQARDGPASQWKIQKKRIARTSKGLLWLQLRRERESGHGRRVAEAALEWASDA